MWGVNIDFIKTSRRPLWTAAIKGVWSEESLMCTLAPIILWFPPAFITFFLFYGSVISFLSILDPKYMSQFSVSPQPFLSSHCTIPIWPLAEATWSGVLPLWSPEISPVKRKWYLMLTCAQIGLVALQSLEATAISKTDNCACQGWQQNLRFEWLFGW